MNILIVLPDKKVGGGQIAALRVAEALSHENKVYALYATPECSDDPAPRIPGGVTPVNFLPGVLEAYLPHTVLRVINAVDNQFTHNLKGQSDGLLLGRLRQWYGALKRKKFSWLLRHLHIDVVNSHVLAADTLVSECIGSQSVAWVVTMHGCYEFCLNDPTRYPDFSTLSRKILSRADRIIYLTEKNKKIFEVLRDQNLDHKAHRVMTGFNGCDDNLSSERFAFLRDSDIVLGLVSRAIPEKGWEEAIQATIAVREETGKNLHLILLGDSQYADNLRHRYDLPFVHFMGFSDEAVAWVRHFDVGLLPSYFAGESLPTAVVEYLVCGKPVIATDVGEVANMISAHGQSAGF